MFLKNVPGEVAPDLGSRLTRRTGVLGKNHPAGLMDSLVTRHTAKEDPRDPSNT